MYFTVDVVMIVSGFLLDRDIKKAENNFRYSLLGWEMGFEPTTFGTTIRHSNQLSYTHRYLIKSFAKVLILFQSTNFFAIFFINFDIKLWLNAIYYRQFATAKQSKRQYFSLLHEGIFAFFGHFLSQKTETTIYIQPNTLYIYQLETFW